MFLLQTNIQDSSRHLRGSFFCKNRQRLQAAKCFQKKISAGFQTGSWMWLCIGFYTSSVATHLELARLCSVCRDRKPDHFRSFDWILYIYIYIYNIYILYIYIYIYNIQSNDLKWSGFLSLQTEHNRANSKWVATLEV